MVERPMSHLWMMRLLFLLLCTTLIFLHLLPLDTTPRSWAGPDLILAMTFAWVLRRPEFVPAPMIALVFLMIDLLYQLPPGLWSAFVLLGTETLRARAPGLRDLTFPAEWITVAITLAMMMLGYQLVLAVLLIDRPPLGLSLMQLFMTLLFYPLVVAASQIVFGVRKQAPGDVDALVNRK